MVNNTDITFHFTFSSYENSNTNVLFLQARREICLIFTETKLNI
jgi:hypothetical protein